MAGPAAESRHYREENKQVPSSHGSAHSRTSRHSIDQGISNHHQTGILAKGGTTQISSKPIHTQNSFKSEQMNPVKVPISRGSQSAVGSRRSVRTGGFMRKDLQI